MSYGSKYVRGQRLSVDIDPAKCKTEQAHKQECDINYILKRYRKTGMLPVANRAPQFGDAITMNSFNAAMNTVAEGKSAFEALPAAVRRKFKNNPKYWLESIDAQISAQRAKIASDAAAAADKAAAVAAEAAKHKPVSP